MKTMHAGESLKMTRTLRCIRLIYRLDLARSDPWGLLIVWSVAGEHAPRYMHAKTGIL
jgi:hypothetical protein